MNVYTYIRVSGKSQLDGDGPERQREAVAGFIKQFEYLCFRGEFFEQISGTVEGVDRPQFAEMLSYIDGRANSPDRIVAVVVERMDRLARDLMVSEVLLSELRKRRVQVFSTDQGTTLDMASDGGDPTRVLIRQIMGALAQWEKSQLVKKLKVARERARAKTGRYGGTRAYGHMPGEKQILTFIASMLNQGSTPEKIAVCLNDGGFKSRYGGKFSRQSIESILKHQKKGK
jgi:DNA invertase Pin-like site-specific DNA recombinase